MTTYRLHPITSTRDPRFVEAISIYAKNMDRQIRTSTNEIAFWLDNYDLHFDPDRLYVMALMADEQVVGYCQFVALVGDGVVIFDYIVLGKSRCRGMPALRAFTTLLKDFVYEKHPCQLMLIEVMAVSGRSFTTLMQRLGFQAWKGYRYTQPSLSRQTAVQHGILMSYPHLNIDDLCFLHTFEAMVEIIHTNHYARWNSYKNLASKHRRYGILP